MISFVHRINKRLKILQNEWKSDCCFSIAFACYRVMDELGGRIGFRRLSSWAHKKKDDYILNYLSEELRPIFDKYKSEAHKGEKVKNAPIWVCWWTGMDSAPLLIQQCINSIRNNSHGHPVRLLSKETISDYIGIPHYIIEKAQNGTMQLAHLADYIRVAVLYRYGGLWLDATVFCSGDIPEWYFDLPFFTCRSEYKESRYLSHYQWTTFCLGGWKENAFYSFMKEAFECYWSQNDLAIDYLFFDAMIYLAKKDNEFIKELIDSVPLNTPHRDDLQTAFCKRLPGEEFENIICEDTPINKLSWRESYSTVTDTGETSVYGRFLNIPLMKN